MFFDEEREMFGKIFKYSKINKYFFQKSKTIIES